VKTVRLAPNRQPTSKEILTVWKDRICLHAEEIDPGSEYAWEGLFVGLVIGMGGTAAQARRLYPKACKLEQQ